MRPHNIFWDGKPKWIQAGRERARELVRARDKYKCQMCKIVWKNGERRFDVHHLNGLCGKNSLKYDSVKNLDPLVTLCHRCHFRRHDFSQRISGDWDEYVNRPAKTKKDKVAYRDKLRKEWLEKVLPSDNIELFNKYSALFPSKSI